MNQTLQSKRRDPLKVATIVTPPVIILLLICLYAASPGFYERYIVSFEQRENQLVELATAGVALTAGVMLLTAAVKLLRMRRKIRSLLAHDAAAWWQGRLAAAHVALIGAAAIFFGGEEVNWGQTLLWVLLPEHFNEKSAPQINIHNARIPGLSVQSLGSLFLIAMFVLLPALFARRDRCGMPRELTYSMPRWPVGVAVAVAMLWSKVKDAYALILGGNPKRDPLYMGFFEQINEHKELLLAVALLFYGLYCLRAARQLGNDSSTKISTAAEPDAGSHL